MRLFMPFVFPNSIFSSKDRKNLITTMLNLFPFVISSLCNRYPKGSHMAWATKRLIIAFELKIEFAKKKCLSIIMSAEMIPTA